MRINKSNVPKLRFPEFTDAWEQRKLGDVAELSKGQGYSKGDLRESGTPIILYGRLYTRYETVIADVDTFVTVKEKSVFSKGGEVIVPASGETAEDISRASVVENTGIILSGDLNILKPKQEIDSAFLAITISNGTQQTELSKRAQGKSVVHLHNSDLQEVWLCYPKLDEQKKLGAFFRNLDRLITLHQRKLGHLQGQKTGLLQKMFPKDGADVPEIRFPEFTDAWEQRRLGEYSTLITKGTTPKDKSGNGTVNFVKIENISNGAIFPVAKVSDEEHDGYLQRSKLAENDILFSIAGTLGRTAIVDKSILPANTNQALAIIRGYDFDTNFFITSLSGNVVSDFVRKNPTIGAQPNLSLKQIGNLRISTPCREEQQQLGTFFAALDRLITLHQRKLKHLQEQKKALLQQMFI